MITKCNENSTQMSSCMSRAAPSRGQKETLNHSELSTDTISSSRLLHKGHRELWRGIASRAHWHPDTANDVIIFPEPGKYTYVPLSIHKFPIALKVCSRVCKSGVDKQGSRAGNTSLDPASTRKEPEICYIPPEICYIPPEMCCIRTCTIH